ncbi:hypothetical protein [Streptomyces sp. NPDC058202]|uniref:hypothetical protein n=1 Tax=Streptomyces sp. NPDC058202 TaxID=3346380 RepID=UPI0036E36975
MLSAHLVDGAPQVIQRRKAHQVWQRGVAADFVQDLVLIYPDVLLATVHRAGKLADPVRVWRVELVDASRPLEDDPVRHDLL